MGFHQGLSSAHYMTIWGLLKTIPEIVRIPMYTG
jgi:hypothetical protein